MELVILFCSGVLEVQCWWQYKSYGVNGGCVAVDVLGIVTAAVAVLANSVSHVLVIPHLPLELVTKER